MEAKTLTNPRSSDYIQETNAAEFRAENARQTSRLERELEACVQMYLHGHARRPTTRPWRLVPPACRIPADQVHNCLHTRRADEVSVGLTILRRDSSQHYLWNSHTRTILITHI